LVHSLVFIYWNIKQSRVNEQQPKEM